MPEGDGQRPRVALACQGGGSHTAFTAGVLKTLLRGGGQDVVGFSGTSGGAICALLAWYGLHTGGPEEAVRRLDAFWADNAARGYWDVLANAWLVNLARLEDYVSLPQLTPYAYPPVANDRLARLLDDHVDFAAVARLSRTAGPVLLVGAVDVLSGEHRVFDSRKGDITRDAVLASAAVPGVFRAVPVAGSLYWDGLFAQNPPVRDLPGAGADEIWVVQINPQRRAREPRSATDILDRRNELSGNLSLEQDLSFIEAMNRLLDEGAFQPDRYRRVGISRIALDHDLDLASKLDRTPSLLRGLMAEGEREAERFLAARRTA